MDIDAFLETEKDKMEKSAGPKAVIKQQGLSIKSNTIEDQLDKLQQMLAQNKFKDAGDLYMQVKERFTNLTKTQIEEKNFIHKKLSQLNEALTIQLSQVMVDVDKKAQMIENLLMKGEGYLKEGKLEVADEMYKQVKQVFDQLPDVFLEKRLRLENNIMNFFSRLNIENAKKMLENFERTKKEVQGLLDHGFQQVQVGRLDLAKKDYLKINQLYSKLPSGFMYDKLMLYKQILKLYNEAELNLEIKALSSELAELEKAMAGSSSAPKPSAIPPPGSAGTIPVPLSKTATNPPAPKPGITQNVSEAPSKPGAAPSAPITPSKPVFKVNNEITPEHLENPPQMQEVPNQAKKLEVPPTPQKKGMFGFMKKSK
ncbi:hypothetical protein HYY69_05820 [Candidatus Woesearchaeota archaeon]|nr:hypothetical protein [Candidatus Woesearchaeota archaeon]